MRSVYSNYTRQYNVDTPFTYIYLLAVSLAFWVIGYINSIGYPVYSETTTLPLWNAICQLLPNKTITYLIGLLLTVGGAFLIHRTNYVLVIIREKTLLPFFLYIFFISTNFDFFPLKPTLAGVFCLILAMYELFTSYHDPKAVFKAYNAALFIGVGSLLWAHIIWFLPLFWIGMYNFKTLNLRTFIASFLSFGTVYWILLAICIYKHDFTYFSSAFVVLSKIRMLDITNTNPTDWIAFVFPGILLLISAIYIFTHVHDDNLRARQYLYFLISFSVLSYLLFFFYEQSSNEFLSVACLSGSILLGHFFTVKKDKKRFFLFHISMILFIVLSSLRLWNS